MHNRNHYLCFNRTKLSPQSAHSRRKQESGRISRGHVHLCWNYLFTTILGIKGLLVDLNNCIDVLLGDSSVSCNSCTVFLH